MDTHVNINVIKCLLLVLNLTKETVSGNCRLGKLLLWLGLGFGLALGFKLGLGDNFPPGNCPRTEQTIKEKEMLRKSRPNF